MTTHNCKTGELCANCGHGWEWHYLGNNRDCLFIHIGPVKYCACSGWLCPERQLARPNDMQLHDQIVELRKQRSAHLMDESDYTDAIIALVHERDLAAVEVFGQSILNNLRSDRDISHLEEHIEERLAALRRGKQ